MKKIPMRSRSEELAAKQKQKPNGLPLERTELWEAAHVARRGNKWRNLEGMLFGQLRVIKAMPTVEKYGRKHGAWICICSCGTKIKTLTNTLTSGHTTSCGCGKWNHAADHGHARVAYVSAEYCAWQQMLARCYYPGNYSYKNYGKKGITVCPRWRKSFRNFMSDMGNRPTGLSLERVNRHKGYSPNNCRWATRQDQANNTSRNVFVRFNGQTKTWAQWIRALPHLHLRPSTICGRINMGWSRKRILTTPARPIRFRS